MKKIYSLFFAFTGLMGFAQAGAPAAYYNGFNFNQTGMALKTALATKITNTHTHQLSYDDIWDADKIVDQDPANSSNVLLVYGNPASGNYTRLKSLTCGNGQPSTGCNGNNRWNREHTYAQSLASPALGTSGPGADAHHLRAVDYDTNENRASEKYTAGTGTAHDITSTTWYPGDEWKGDIARMMMYMYLRYGSQCLPTDVGNGTPVSTDANMIGLFLQWNAEDPVSQVEDQRNTYLGNAGNTYGQGNRNPFIDNPYLATVIWGGTPAENRWPNVFLALPDFDWVKTVTVYPNPAQGGHVNVSSAVALDAIQVYNINGQLVLELIKPVMTDNAVELNGLQQGFYMVKATSANQTVTKKLLVN